MSLSSTNEMVSKVISDNISTWIWAPHEKYHLSPAKIVALRSDNVYICEFLDGETVRITSKDFVHLSPVIKSTLECVYDDLISLDDFSEGGILYQLKERYKVLTI